MRIRHIIPTALQSLLLTQVHAVDLSPLRLLLDHVVVEGETVKKEDKVEAPVISEIKLIPTDVIAGNLIPEGTTMTMFASKEDNEIINPTALCFDEQGALYLAETPRFGKQVLDARGHRYWFLDDLKAKTTADRLALHEKWKHKVSLESMRENSERILKFTDSDGDGKSDSVTTFADGFNDILDGVGAGVFAHEGKVYFACIPKLYILEDSNGDGISDKREIIADGFGVKIWFSGHDLNGFALGNDGRIYATIGDRGFSTTTREGKQISIPNQGVVMRFEPDGSGLEVVHTGLRNPKEIAFDDFGNGMTVDNNSDQGDKARLVYVMDGVDSGWTAGHQAMFSFREEIGLPETPINMWMAEKMSLERNDSQPAFMVPPVANITNGPSGLTYYPGTGFLSNQKGRFLICDFRGNQPGSRIWSFKVSPDGAGMKLDDNYVLNQGVAATDVEYSYDGRLFVTDFITGWGGERSGQIYSLSATSEKGSGHTPDVAKIFKEGFTQRSNKELLDLMKHPDRRIRLRAHIELTKKKGGINTLITATKGEDRMQRLHGVWGLGILARKNSEKAATNTLVSLLTDADSEVRAQAAQCLGEVAGVDKSVLVPLLRDNSNRVRGFAALSLAKQKYTTAAPEIVTMLEENGGKDLYLAHAGIMGLVGTADAEQISKLAGSPSPAVRMAAVVALRRLQSPLLEVFLKDADGKIVDEAIRAIHEAPVEASRPAIAAILDAYSDGGKGRELTPMITRRLIHSAFRVGGTENAERLVKAALSENLGINERKEALRLLLQWTEPHPVDQSLGIWDPLEKRDAAVLLSILEKGIPMLLSSDKALVEPSLRLLEHYEMKPATVPPASLILIAKDADYPEGARSEALALFLRSEPASADELLISLVNDPSDVVSSFSLESLVKRDPAKAAAGLDAALKSEKVARRQSAWTIAGDLPGEQSAILIATALTRAREGKGDPASLIELLDAAGKRSEPAVKSALDTYKASLDATDPLAAWLPALEGGDATKGAEFFKNHGSAQCMRCHRVEDSDENSVMAGPNLAGLGAKHDSRYMLESMMNPGAVVAPGFGIVSLTLNNGNNLGGILQGESAEYLDITVGEDTWRVKRSDIKASTAPVSAMPPMSAMLSLRETRDLVAYLSNLKKPLEHAPDLPEAKPYVPTKK